MSCASAASSFPFSSALYLAAPRSRIIQEAPGYLERHVAHTGEVLTEAQVTALEKKQDDDSNHGEFETAHPGYLGSQDTFYFGTI